MVLRVAVVGSGPAGSSAAEVLAKAGIETYLFERKLDNAKPEIQTVSHLWQTAIFHEREVYEMFGVNFLNHPDLRLLILPDGWEGKNPMRKDFEDAVNMIKL